MLVKRQHYGFAGVGLNQASIFSPSESLKQNFNILEVRSCIVQRPSEKEGVMSWNPIFHVVFAVIPVVVMKWNYFNVVHHFFSPL